MPFQALVKTLENDLIPSVLAGSVAGLAAMSLLGTRGNVPFPLVGEVNASVAAGLSAGAGNLLGSVSEDVVTRLPLPEFLQEGSALLKPALAGVGTYSVMRFGVSENVNALQALALGAGSSFAGNWVFENFIKDRL